MVTLTKFEKNRIARRRTSDITRLTDQYKNSMDAVTSDYETSFANYSKKRDETLAPYNKAMDQYKTDFSAYESNLSGYKERLSAYTAKLEDALANPLTEVDPSTYKKQSLIRYGTTLTINGTNYAAGDGMVGTTLPDGYTYENGKLYQKKDPGKFEEKAPTAPTAPIEPKVEDFDTTAFDAKRADLESTFKREIGERKSAKLGAVARRQARPMLQGS